MRDGSFNYTILPKIDKPKLHGFVNCSGNNVVLLLLRELDEVYSVLHVVLPSFYFIFSVFCFLIS